MKRTRIGLAILAVTAACSSTPTYHFYNLGEAAPAASNQSIAPDATLIVVGPVSVPDAVDRPQMVVRQSNGELRLFEAHRWAGRLRDEIPRQLASRLARLKPRSAVLPYPQASSRQVQAQVLLDILQFELHAGREARLEAVWTIKGAGEAAPRIGRAVLVQPVTGADPAALAAAQAVLLSQLAQAIAGAL